jgi:hypothetical protein
MIDAVLEHDGRISRLLGDGMRALFGTPLAHESDPERAILAALRIREEVQKFGLNVTAGINTGEACAGGLGLSVAAVRRCKLAPTWGGTANQEPGLRSNVYRCGGGPERWRSDPQSGRWGVRLCGRRRRPPS